MLNTGVVQVSGRGTSVDFTIDDTSPFDQVTHGLRKYLVDNRGLWSKGSITVNAGLRIGSWDQLNELKAIIEKESGLTVARFWCSPDSIDPPSSQRSAAGPQGQTPGQTSQAPEFPSAQQTEKLVQPRAHNEYPLAKRENGAAPATALRSLPIITGNPDLGPNPLDFGKGLGPVTNSETKPTPLYIEYIEDARDSLFTLSSRAQDTLDEIDYMESRRDTALFIKSTCRSGEVIRHQGDVVVLGDVNPGAEIVAAGDITIFGSLRGLAHAGSEGLTKAVIIAYRLESPRLQIGPYVGVAADPLGGEGAGERDKSADPTPVIAYLKRRSIYVAAFAGRFARYSRGILYEG